LLAFFGNEIDLKQTRVRESAADATQKCFEVLRRRKQREKNMFVHLRTKKFGGIGGKSQIAKFFGDCETFPGHLKGFEGKQMGE
jgi:hypothetical protein